jgi:hypothetical protein
MGLITTNKTTSGSIQPTKPYKAYLTAGSSTSYYTVLDIISAK